jgi:hypothetical protein
MEQLQFSGAFPRVRPTDKVVCFQRTNRGRFVGTLCQTDTGYTGFLIAPKHPLLPDGAGTGSLGFLHAERHEAYAKLAMHVAKQSWDGQLGFEATCLEGLDELVKNQYENWLIDNVCNIRATTIHGQNSASSERQQTARTIRADVVAERANLLLAQNMDRASGSRVLQ